MDGGMGGWQACSKQPHGSSSSACAPPPRHVPSRPRHVPVTFLSRPVFSVTSLSRPVFPRHVPVTSPSRPAFPRHVPVTSRHFPITSVLDTDPRRPLTPCLRARSHPNPSHPNPSHPNPSHRSRAEHGPARYSTHDRRAGQSTAADWPSRQTATRPDDWPARLSCGIGPGSCRPLTGHGHETR